jgi:quercetin dioxygenase-like cupin family protein
MSSPSESSLVPAGPLPVHRHDRCHVLLALDDVQFRDEADDGSREVHLKPGEALWYPASIQHRLKNLDKQDVRLLTVEFK